VTAPFFAIDDVTVRFGGLTALNAFSMTVEQGEIHALIGPNGAGKSTVFNVISRFYAPAAGDMRFEGRSLLAVPAHGIAGLGIGRTFQNIELCGQLTVLENVIVGMSARIPRYLSFLVGPTRLTAERQAVRDASALLERLGLLPFRDVPAEQLDFGRKKLLDIARALALRPRLLLLDEPAAGLRNREIAELDALLVGLAREQNLTIILVEHVMQLVMAIADRITVLNFGQCIAGGRPEEVRSNEAVIEDYLGRNAHAAA